MASVSKVMPFCKMVDLNDSGIGLMVATGVLMFALISVGPSARLRRTREKKSRTVSLKNQFLVFVALIVKLDCFPACLLILNLLPVLRKL